MVEMKTNAKYVFKQSEFEYEQNKFMLELLNGNSFLESRIGLLRSKD